MDSAHFTWFDRILANERQLQVLKRLVPGESLLDFGCGAEPVLLRKAASFISYGVGIDYDAVHLDEGNIIVRKALVKDKFPLPDSYIDVVSMTAVLEHFSQSDALYILQAARAVLKPGGRVILTTPTPEGKWILEPVARLTPLIAKAEVLDHKHYYSQSDIMNLARQAGLYLTEYSRFEFGGNSVAVLRKEA